MICNKSYLADILGVCEINDLILVLRFGQCTTISGLGPLLYRTLLHTYSTYRQTDELEMARLVLLVTVIPVIVVIFDLILVRSVFATFPGLEVINLEASLRLKIKRNDWLLVDTCPQAANHCALF